MPTCPNGHQSGSDDWCEVCGHRMAGAVPPPPPPPPGGGYGFPPPAPGRTPSAEAELCPQCRTPREGGAPFCEECRWNFLTNTATSYTPAAPRPTSPGPSPAARFQQPPGPGAGPGAGPGPTYGGDSYEYQGSRPSRMNRPAEPIPPFGGEPSGRPGNPGAQGYGNDRQGGPGDPGPQGYGNDRQGGPGGPRNPGGPGAQGFGGERQGGNAFGANDPSGPPRPPFGNNEASGPPRPPFGNEASGRPGAFGNEQSPGGGGPFGNERPGQNEFGGGRPGAFGGERQGPPGPFGNEPSNPQGPPNFGGPDPSRQVPPPPGPTPPSGPGRTSGAPQAFQQSAPPAPPGFPQETNRPQQGGSPFGGGDDDWVISPPTPGSPGGPGGQGGPGGPGGPGQGGGYGYPQPGSTQAPPGRPAYQQQPTTWLATIGPDREYFMAMMQRSGPEAAGLNLPAYSPEQQRQLTGNQITIGRRRHSTGESPDIDLSVPPEDPGVSHQHAVLVQQPDGSWAVVDQNSTNGTTVNGGEEPIQPFVPVPLQDGDRVHVGAWTTITVRRG
ncbi:FHA domain-containing protein [Streptomyces sp. NPDC096142]|uniref:FHA domain-containing protein n=1 Tax=Streptomyces sp. NPDC096142 TaxID=3366077 RepID=UPI00381DEF3E